MDGGAIAGGEEVGYSIRAVGGGIIRLESPSGRNQEVIAAEATRCSQTTVAESLDSEANGIATRVRAESLTLMRFRTTSESATS